MKTKKSKTRKRKSALKVALDGFKILSICFIILCLFALPIYLVEVTGNKDWGFLYILTLGPLILAVAGDGIQINERY